MTHAFVELLKGHQPAGSRLMPLVGLTRVKPRHMLKAMLKRKAPRQHLRQQLPLAGAASHVLSSTLGLATSACGKQFYPWLLSSGGKQFYLVSQPMASQLSS